MFSVDAFYFSDPGRNAIRVHQGDFQTAYWFCIGAGAAGAIIRTLSCNLAGDISGAEWSDDLQEIPFSDKIRKVEAN